MTFVSFTVLYYFKLIQQNICLRCLLQSFSILHFLPLSLYLSLSFSLYLSLFSYFFCFTCYSTFRVKNTLLPLCLAHSGSAFLAHSISILNFGIYFLYSCYLLSLLCIFCVLLCRILFETNSLSFVKFFNFSLCYYSVNVTLLTSH